jgi:arabinose-5-phosphate isomerase
VTLVKIKGFTKNDFAKFHPGGNLGKRLILKVKNLINLDLKPTNNINNSVNDVIIEISEKMLGITTVMDNQKIVGVITDGDLRRTLLNHKEISNLTAGEIMSSNPQSVDCELLAVDALEIMKQNKISQLIVTEKGKYFGILHIQNLINEGFTS